MEQGTHTALLIIDMQNAFLEKNSPFYIQGAKETVPVCVQAVETAREKGMPVFFIKREYRENGSDVEITRYHRWKENGRPLAPKSWSAQWPAELCPQKEDFVVVKPRWSAFFHTELDLILRRLEIRTVVVAGTTTPNCIRTTVYDANALDYHVVVIQDGTSSQTEEIQRVNLEDMQRMGAVILSASEFRDFDGDRMCQPLGGGKKTGGL